MVDLVLVPCWDCRNLAGLEGQKVTYYPHDGQMLTREELLDEILSTWKVDREKAKEIVSEHDLWWHDVIEHQEGREE